MMMMMMPGDVFAKEGGDLGLILSCFACSLLRAGKYKVCFAGMFLGGGKGCSRDPYQNCGGEFIFAEVGTLSFPFFYE